MKKVLIAVFVISVLSVGNLVFSQGSPTNLDRTNGYKDFKFGKSKKELSQFIFAPVGSFDNPKIQQTLCYNCSEEYLTFGAKFSSIFLDFYLDQLYRISLFKTITKEEFDSQIYLYNNFGLLTDCELIANKVVALFGPISEENKKSTNTSATHYVYGTSVTFIFEWSFQTSPFSGETVLYITVDFINNRLYNEAEVSKY
jgi:hypothetical protein